MGQEKRTLGDLRREIDAIDDALHDLLMQRAEASSAIARVKQEAADGAPAIRPAREAAILRRLMDRHRGLMARRAVVRIWREIMAASLQVQAKFQLHVFGGDNQTVYHDIARGYFGSMLPIRTHTKVSLVVHACAEEANAVGVVPLPEFEAPNTAWWSQLAPAGERGARVFAKLPFAVDSEDTVSAYALGAVEQEPSGDDTTLLVLEITAGLSRAKLQSFFKEAGLDAKLVATGRLSEKNAPDEVLVEAHGFLAKDDPVLKRLLDVAGDAVSRATPVGGFANPIVVASPR
jgi:chorismate mutase-like protein